MHVLRNVLIVPFWNMFQIGIVCRSKNVPKMFQIDTVQISSYLIFMLNARFWSQNKNTYMTRRMCSDKFAV